MTDDHEVSQSGKEHLENIRQQRIRRLNDRLRVSGHGGRTLITPGIAEQGPDFVQALRQAVAAFAAFTEENDPYGEHDFGALTFGDQKVFWKIDYYDLSLTGGSPDPSNASVTTRVLTIMLAHEY